MATRRLARKGLEPWGCLRPGESGPRAINSTNRRGEVYDGSDWRTPGAATPNLRSIDWARPAPAVGQRRIGDNLLVLVRDNNVEQALKYLKKKMQREGIFREMKRRKAYEKPSEKRVREKAEAIRRARKLARKVAIREGLIAEPKPKLRTPGAGRAKPAFG